MHLSRRFYHFCVSLFIIILPMIVVPQFPNPYEFPKFIVFVVFSSLLTLLLLKVYWQSNCSKANQLLDHLTTFVLLFAAVSLIADFIGLDPYTSILGSKFRHQGYVTLASGVLVFFTLRAIQKSTTSRAVFPYQTAIVTSNILVSIFTLWQGMRVYLFHDLTIPTYFGRIVGTLGNPNVLGGYIAITFPFLLFYPTTSHRYLVLVKGFFIFANVVSIFFSSSRSAILAIGSVIILIVIQAFSQFFPGQRLATWVRRQRIVLFMVGISSLLIMALILANQPHHISVRNMLNSLSLTEEKTRTSLWDNQLVIWTEGVKAVIQRPILGYGQENFEVAIPRERRMMVDNAHNVFLEVAVSSGLIGLSIYLAILLFAWQRAKPIIKLYLLAFLIRSQFNPLSISDLALFWIILSEV